MMKQLTMHWRYLSYVMRHKWFVLIAGLKVGAPIWRLVKHDWTKFLPCEWVGYVLTFYGEWKWAERPPELVARFDRAWLHHQHNNDHHWQHWVLREDSGAVKLLEMPMDCVLEMVADWAGAGRAIRGKWEVQPWYEQNRDKILLHPESRKLTEILIEVYFEQGGNAS